MPKQPLHAQLPLLLLAGLLLSKPVAAGEISGTIIAGRGPLTGATVKLECPGKQNPEDKTDNFGRYRLVVPDTITGRCMLTVGGSQPVEVYVFKAPTRYDFELAGNNLRRR